MFGAATIVASNYVAFARVLADSFRRHNPDAPFWVLVVDDPDGVWVVDDEESFNVLRLRDVGIDDLSAARMAGIYDVLELSTSVKPWLLQSLAARFRHPILYLDPDIQVFTPLDQLAELAERHGLVVTPHLLEPLPLDGLYPDDPHMLRAGIHNLGFLGVGPAALDGGFFEFWQSRVWRHAIVDLETQVFTDQRWLDWIDCFEHVVSRDPGCNVAYWNVWARPISRDGDSWRASDVPLRFFHFSGFDPSRPWALSRHQLDRPRVQLSEHPDLAELCRSYAALLLAAGHEECRRRPYGWGRAGEISLTRPARRIYRGELMRAEAAGGPVPPGPFEGPPGAFAEWLCRMVGSDGTECRGGSGIPRFLAAEHQDRPDLRAAFPDPAGSSRDALLEWARRDQRLSSEAPALVLRLPVPTSPGEALLPGVNVAGYLSAEMGVGTVGRLVVQAAQAAGLPVWTHDNPRTVSRRGHGGPVADGRAWPYDVNVLCANADATPELMAAIGPSSRAGRANVGVWHWEAERLAPGMRASWDLVDEVWAVSRFSMDSLARDATKPLRLFPLPVPVPAHRSALRREDLGLPDGFLVLFCFDWLSVVERKNPMGLVDAYCRAFRPGEGAHLVVKTINGSRYAAELERLRLSTDRPDVQVADGYLTPVENAALTQLCDCYASLHRSEGFGLTLAEAMAVAKPVVATAWSGNLDFMTEDVSLLVPAELVPVPDAVPVYGGLGRWADPDLDAAAWALRWVFENPGEATALGRRGQEHLRDTRSASRAAGFLAHHAERLGRLRRAS